MLARQTMSRINPIIWLYAIWMVIIFFDERLYNKLFLSNLVAIGLCAYTSVIATYEKFKEMRFILAALAFIVIITICSSIQFGIQMNFIEELAKSLLVLLGGITISKLYSTEQLEWILKPVPIILTLYFFIQFFIIGAPLSSSRLSLDRSLGCANTIAYFMAFSIVILLCCYRSNSWWKWLIICFLTYLLADTYSRSTIFGLTLAIVATLLFRRKKKFSKTDCLMLLIPLMIVINLVILEKFAIFLYQHPIPTLVHFDNSPYIGGIARFYPHTMDTSGRFSMWLNIIQTIFQHPKALLTGFGPGLVPQLNLYHNHYLSIDSIVVKFLYSFGIIGLLLAIIFCIKLALPRSETHHYQVLKSMLGILTVFCLLANDTTSASQTILYGMLLIALVFSREKNYDNKQINIIN